MKITVYTSVLALVLLSACGSNGERKIISVEKKVVYKEPVAVKVNSEITLDISGMSCENACGGTIRMALKNTNAVERCSFDFKAERPTNKAFITYDKDKISPDAIVALIEQLNNRQFKTANPVYKVIEQLPTATQPAPTPVKASNDEACIQIETEPSFELPNLFEVFSHFMS